MATICPTVTAYSTEEYKKQIDLISSFAPRIHIDFMDGLFAPTVSQTVHESWLPRKVASDLHIMYRHPMHVLQDVIDMHPHLVIVHAEAEHVSSFVHAIHEHRMKVGIALLQDTNVEILSHFINVIDHVLVFSGKLGHHGGVADLALLEKVAAIKALKPTIEIGWDGGINDTNIRQLVDGGVDVLNVGGFIHANENPENAYRQLRELIQ